MKTFVVQTFAWMLIAFGMPAEVEAQYVTIPDANFRTRLQQLYPACFNGGGQMNTNCSAIINEMELLVGNLGITNLGGIEYFSSLLR